MPSNVNLYETTSKCNRNHVIVPLIDKVGCIQSKSSPLHCLPGLICLTCQKCVAVYLPEDRDNCQSPNQSNHYQNVESILTSADKNQVI